MKNQRTLIQQQENMLADLARRIRHLREEIEAMMRTPIRSEPISFYFVYALTFFAVVAAYVFDVLMLRPCVEYMAGLASQNLAVLAIYLVPLIIILLELYLSVSRTRTLYFQDTPGQDSGPFGHTVYPSIPIGLLNFICALVLCIQLFSGYAMYTALRDFNPTMMDSNRALLGFLLIAAVSTHLVVLTCGSSLLSWAEAIANSRRLHTIKKKQLQYSVAQRRLEMQYRSYKSIVDEYNQASSAPYIPDLGPITTAEIEPLVTPARPASIPSPYVY